MYKRQLLQFGAEDFSIEPFGGDIEELENAEYTVLQCDDDFLPAHCLLYTSLVTFPPFQKTF